MSSPGVLVHLLSTGSRGHIRGVPRSPAVGPEIVPSQYVSSPKRQAVRTYVGLTIGRSLKPYVEDFRVKRVDLLPITTVNGALQ